MNVLSLFDGMSCGQMALRKLGIKVDNYYASEIEKPAMKVTQHNFPETHQIGDVTKVKAADLPKIDLFFGGSPCQGFSAANTSARSGKSLEAFNHPSSILFYEYMRLLREVKPKYFLLENVPMKQEHEDVITELLGVHPIKINSSLMTGHFRRRLYWTNLPDFQMPLDKGIYLKDIMEPPEDIPQDLWLKSGTVKKLTYEIQKDTIIRKDKPIRIAHFDSEKWNVPSQSKRVYSPQGKSACQTASGNGKDTLLFVDKTRENIRKLSPIESERLQGVPDNYSKVPGVSNNQRYKMLGNGWTVTVIAHIFRGLRKEYGNKSV